MAQPSPTPKIVIRSVWTRYDGKDMSKALIKRQNELGLEPGWYRWRVFLEGAPEIMKKIVKVTYFLHPTFPQREIQITDQETGFAIENTGWGSFDLIIDIKFSNETAKRGIRYFLDLANDDPAPKEVALENFYLT